jgi:hypothetical protein
MSRYKSQRKICTVDALHATRREDHIPGSARASFSPWYCAEAPGSKTRFFLNPHPRGTGGVDRNE